MQQRLYNSPEWRRLRERVIARDSDRCSVGRLIGGDCHPTLHVHHITPVSEGGSPYDEANTITVCATHHPMLESLHRRLNQPRHRCGHRHPYPQGREECERRMAKLAA